MDILDNMGVSKLSAKGFKKKKKKKKWTTPLKVPYYAPFHKI